MQMSEEVKRLYEATQILHLIQLESGSSTLDTLALEPKRLFNKPSKHCGLADAMVLQSLMLLGSLMKDVQQTLLNTPLTTRMCSSGHLRSYTLVFQLTLETKYCQPILNRNL